MLHATAQTLRAAVDFEGAVDDVVSSVARFVPKFIGFLVILLIGWIVARLLRTLVTKILERVHFDRAVERGGIKQALSGTNYDAIGLVASLVFYAVLLIALQLAFGVFGPNPVSDLIAGLVAWLPKAVVAIIIIVIAAAIARVVRDLIHGAIGGLSYGPFLAKVTGWFIVGLGVIAALNQIEVAAAVTTPILVALLATLAGVIIVGVGGGLVRPMQQRWEGWITHAEQETAGAVSQRDSASNDVDGGVDPASAVPSDGASVYRQP